MRAPANPASPLVPETDQETDAAVVSRVARGDRSALSLLYQRHASLLLAVAMKILQRRRE
ncbi:MAG: hypothetical protein JST92_05090, partial [Deltaproteobacteria bacterium]|nr:hypothetical protein [Deltaproteobacteria bacterium]